MAYAWYGQGDLGDSRSGSEISGTVCSDRISLHPPLATTPRGMVMGIYGPLLFIAACILIPQALAANITVLANDSILVYQRLDQSSPGTIDKYKGSVV